MSKQSRESVARFYVRLNMWAARRGRADCISARDATYWGTDSRGDNTLKILMETTYLGKPGWADGALLSSLVYRKFSDTVTCIRLCVTLLPTMHYNGNVIELLLHFCLCTTRGQTAPGCSLSSLMTMCIHTCVRFNSETVQNIPAGNPHV